MKKEINPWTIERANNIVLSRYPHLIFLEMKKEEGGKKWFYYFDPNIKEGNFGSKTNPYIWNRSNLREGHFKIRKVYYQEELDNIILKKYPNLIFHHIENNQDVFYYDKELEEGVYGSFSYPYKWYVGNINKNLFSTECIIYNLKKINNIVLQKYPNLCFLKKEYNHDATFYYYDSNKKETSYGSIQNPYIWTGFNIVNNTFSINKRYAGEEEFKEALLYVTSNFIKGKMTIKKYRLKPDFTIDKYNCFVEINGGQHYFFVNHFHETYEDYVNQQNRDKEKIIYSKEIGWDIIIIPNIFDKEIFSYKNKYKIEIYQFGGKSLELLEKLKNTKINWWLNSFEIIIKNNI